MPFSQISGDFSWIFESKYAVLIQDFKNLNPKIRCLRGNIFCGLWKYLKVFLDVYWMLILKNEYCSVPSFSWWWKKKEEKQHFVINKCKPFSITRIKFPSFHIDKNVLGNDKKRFPCIELLFSVNLYFLILQFILFFFFPHVFWVFLCVLSRTSITFIRTSKISLLQVFTSEGCEAFSQHCKNAAKIFFFRYFSNEIASR